MRKPLLPDALRAAPFTTAMAAAHGVSASALQGPTWRHVFRNVWMYAGLPDSREMRLQAVQLILGEDAFLCGPTAAWVHGIDVQDHRRDLVWVGFPKRTRRRQRPGCLVREITVTDGDLTRIDDVVVTTPLRTVFDCARWLSLVEGVVVADALAHAGLLSPDCLAAYVSDHRRLRGVRRVDRVLEMIDPTAESPMESRLRVLLVCAGLPRPVGQHVVLDPVGAFVARLDLAYPEPRLAIEYDGSLHWKQRRADDRRRDELRSLGWTVLVVSAEDYYRTPDLVINKVRLALAAQSDAHGGMAGP